MEIFVDFGLFELLAVAGLALIARRVYTKRWLAFGFLLLSLITPIVLVIFNEGWIRWIAVVCLATALINVSLILSLIQNRDMTTLLDKKPASESPMVQE
jgi:Kef-type K+ transport system membrane component KefB